MGPIRYALWSAAAFMSQHLLVLILFKWRDMPLDMNWAFYVVPLRSLVTCDVLRASACIGQMPVIEHLVVRAICCLCWVLAALAFRRAANRHQQWVAAFAMAPVLQLPVISAQFFPARPASEGMAAATVSRRYGLEGGRVGVAWASA
jgi:hypothetical protein